MRTKIDDLANTFANGMRCEVCPAQCPNNVRFHDNCAGKLKHLMIEAVAASIVFPDKVGEKSICKTTGDSCSECVEHPN